MIHMQLVSKNFRTYFSAKFILSKGALISIVFSDRSDGKTFDCKARALLEYEKDKSITVYMRRYKSEITNKMYSTFFDEVLNQEEYERFRKYKFKGSRTGVQISLDGKEWDYIVYFVPLSISARLKSQISDVYRIHTIDYDEVIPLDNVYLPKETMLLLEFYKSIDRDRETTQLILLGNRITPFNPYFDFFGVKLQITKEQIKLYRNGTVAVQIYVNKEHREKREQGKFRDMVADTEYADYDSGGILKALNLKKKSRDDFRYWSSFKTEIGEGSIWYKNGQMVISEYQRKDGFLITDKIYDVNREQYQCNFGRFPMLFKQIYKTGNMFFESEKAFYLFENILEKIGTV